jgi:hypothetical protein
LFGALAHADESEMTTLSVAHSLIVEPAAIISHAKLYSPRIEYEIHKDPLWLRVFHGVIDSLLSDAQQIVFHQSRQRPECTVDFNLRLDIRLIRQSPRSLTQRRRQIFVFKSRRSQLPNVAARFSDSMTDLPARSIQMTHRRVSTRRHRPCDYFQLHGNSGHLLGQVVMNLAGDARSLSQHRAELRLHAAHTKPE